MTKEEMEQAKNKDLAMTLAMEMGIDTENGEVWQEVSRTKSSKTPEKSTTLEVKGTQDENYY